MKFDLKAYPKLKEISLYDTWYKDTLATFRAQGMEDILNPNFAPDPSNQDDCMLWQNIQACAYTMLRYAIKPIELRQYVEAQCETSNAQLVFIQMTDHVKKSTYAMIITRDMLKQIVTARLNIKTWTKPTYEYIVALNQMFELYNKQQSNPSLHINEHMARAYMQNALSGVKMFQEVTERETDRMITGGVPFTYEEYMISIKSTASKMDALRATRSTRDANVMLYGEPNDDSDDPPPTTRRDINMAELYEIYEAKRRTFRDPSSFADTMNKETWNSLTKATQEVWDTITKEDKAKILEHAMKRAERRSQANSHTIEDSKTISANVHEVKDDDTEGKDTLTEEEKPSISINNVLTGARSEAHAGDPRRVMGSSKPSVRNNLEAMMHRMSTSYDTSDSDEVSSGEEDEYQYPDFHLGGR